MGRQDGPGSESGGNVGYGGGGSFGGGMDEGQGSVSADTYSGGSGIASGGGRQDGPGGSQEEQGYTASGRMSGPGAEAYNAALDAISRGMDPYATSTQNYVAGQLGARPPVDIPGMFGYDTKKGFVENVANMAIPGRNTPLGALSAVVPGTDTVKGIVGLANTIAGRFGIGSTTNPATKNTGIASGNTIVGKDSIIGEYTGRPDDAPMPSAPSGRAQTEAGQFMQSNYTDRNISDMPPGTQQTAFTLDDISNFQMPTVDIPNLQLAPSRGPAINDVLDAFGLPRSVDVPTPFGDVNVGFPDRNPVTPESIDTSFRALGGPSTANQVAGLGSFFEKAKALGEGIVSIPGGYMDTETGKTYSGTYDKDRDVQTFTGTRAPSGASPFTFESFIQNIGK